MYYYARNTTYGNSNPEPVGKLWFDFDLDINHDNNKYAAKKLSSIRGITKLKTKDKLNSNMNFGFKFKNVEIYETYCDYSHKILLNNAFNSNVNKEDGFGSSTNENEGTSEAYPMKYYRYVLNEFRLHVIKDGVIHFTKTIQTDTNGANHSNSLEYLNDNNLNKNYNINDVPYIENASYVIEFNPILHKSMIVGDGGSDQPTCYR